jgi:hypothetical protein
VCNINTGLNRGGGEEKAFRFIHIEEKLQLRAVLLVIGFLLGVMNRDKTI